MSSQEHFELLLDEDWNGGQYQGPINDLANEEIIIEETGAHAADVRMNERAALERFLRLRPVSQQAQPQIQPQIQYPQVHAKPINEFTEDGYVVKVVGQIWYIQQCAQLR